MRRSTLLLGFLPLFSVQLVNASQMVDETQLFRGFALSQCLARAYPDNPVAKDARASAGGYLEFGSLPIEAYEEAVALADKAVAKHYMSKHGEPLQTMKCIDFAFGSELLALIQRYLPEATPSSKAK